MKKQIDDPAARNPTAAKPETMNTSRGAERAWFRLDGSNRKIVSGGQTRYYLLHVPPNLDPSTPAALVVTFHGFAEWPTHVMRTSRWNDLADKHGFIVVYPSGSGIPKRWRTGLTGSWQEDSQPDMQFATDLIANLESRYNIDPRRIYLNGFSNGGGFSHMLSYEMAERFAALASVSGALIHPTRAHALARPVPMIAFHGTADRILPFYGGSTRHFSYTFPPVSDWVTRWVELNGCNPVPETILTSPHVTAQHYRSSDEHGEVTFYTIEGGGHAWPGGVPLPRWIAGRTTNEIDATGLIWEFFCRHPLSD